MKYIGEILFACFIISSLIDKRRILNGKLFTGSMYFFLMHFILLLQNNQNDFISRIGFFVLSALFALFPIIFFSIGFALFINSLMMFKYEGRRLQHLLGFAVGIVSFSIFLFMIAGPYFIQLKQWMVIPYYVVMSLILYYTFLFVSFMVSSMLFNMNRPKLNQDFILILGSGLLYDKVSPLLMARIDSGLKFYRRQKEKSDHPCRFIVSGGQGDDEKMAEAVAMKMVLIEKGIPSEEILVEDHSRTTYENMLFSKKIMDQEMPQYRCVFATNNYHLFRSGIYAKKAGLKKAEGVGAPTASYYIPSAFIREFVAYLNIHRQVNIILVLSAILLTLLASMISAIGNL